MKHSTLFLLSLIATFDVFAVDFNINMDEAKTIKANKIEYNMQSEEIKTSGDTEITNVSGDHLTSDKIEYNIKTEQIKASGNAEMTNSEGQRAKLDTITLSKNHENIDAQNIELWLGKHVYIRAKEMTRRGNDTIAKHAVFTACDGCDDYGNAWEISSYRIIHDKTDKMLYFHSASFWLYNGILPIFWLPYYEMPDPSVKYKSGLLAPSMNSTNGMGTQYNIPLYINFSNKHDLVTTFSYLTNENPLFQIEHRLNLRRSEFRTKGSYTRNKQGKERWHVFNNDKIELGENARALIYVARTSDKTYLQKYGFYDYQPFLDSGAKLELFGQTSYAVADAHIYQELRQPGRNQKAVSGNILPNIRGVYQTDPFYKETFISISGDVLAIDGKQSANQRVIGEARIVSPWTLWGGNRLTLSAASRYDVYNFETTPVYNDGVLEQSYTGVKTRFLPSAYAEWGLPMYSVKNSWTYIIEPRARLTVMEHNDKSAVFATTNDSEARFLSDTTLFSDNRFAGFDVWENGNFVDYGARWAAFNDNNNIEVFIGQTYDFNTQDEAFNDNGFRNGFSDYVGRVSYAREYFQIASRYRIDRDKGSLNHTENSVYFGTTKNYITLGHIWDTQPIDTYSNKDQDTHEAISGFGLQLTKRIRIKESVVYNIYERLIQRHSGGVYYDHPCFYLSLQYKHDNAIKSDYIGDTTYQFKFGISIDGRRY